MGVDTGSYVPSSVAWGTMARGNPGLVDSGCSAANGSQEFARASFGRPALDGDCWSRVADSRTPGKAPARPWKKQHSTGGALSGAVWWILLGSRASWGGEGRARLQIPCTAAWLGQLRGEEG